MVELLLLLWCSRRYVICLAIILFKCGYASAACLCALWEHGTLKNIFVWMFVFLHLKFFFFHFFKKKGFFLKNDWSTLEDIWGLSAGSCTGIGIYTDAVPIALSSALVAKQNNTSNSHVPAITTWSIMMDMYAARRSIVRNGEVLEGYFFIWSSWRFFLM